MPHTPGPVHYGDENSCNGHRLVYAHDGYLLADFVCFRRSDEENKGNALRAAECWNAREGMQQPEVAVAWARKAIALMLKEWTRDQITEETFRALETAASALGKKP